MSEVRPQVSGLIRRRFFTEGALVKAGQTLYEIDPRRFRAGAAEANANLSSALAECRSHPRPCRTVEAAGRSAGGSDAGLH